MDLDEEGRTHLLYYPLTPYRDSQNILHGSSRAQQNVFLTIKVAHAYDFENPNILKGL